ncbi:MAG: hypothetical protein K2Y28_11070 [Burkholderiaceae bacterium]|nr:hypothetical protein [Burkholderiaceae bacterium]
MSKKIENEAQFINATHAADSLSVDDITLEQEDVLHLALQQALSPPALPVGFRAHLLNAALQESLLDVESRKRALDLEYAQSLRNLHRGYVRLQRDTLALILVIAFTLGACVHLALPWIITVLTMETALTVTMVGAAICLCVGGTVCFARYARSS